MFFRASSSSASVCATYITTVSTAIATKSSAR
jgi:hypothetical protein